MSKFKKSYLVSKPRRQELRRRQTAAEELLWPALRALRKSGYIFRRQHSIDWYIADFYCPKAQLVIEVDGDIHVQGMHEANDEVRDQYMETRGIYVLRFRNEEIEKDLQGVVLKIMQVVGLC